MNENTVGKIVKSMISVSGIVILAKIIGFVRQVITADAFGATIQTDIIFLSEGLISNVDYLLVHALSTAFVPTYIVVINKNKEEGLQFVSSTIRVFLFVSLSVALLFFVGSPIIAKLLAPSYNEELTHNLSKYIKIFSPAVVFLTELAVFNSLLKANEKFVPGELIGFNQSAIVIVLVLILSGRLGPDTLVISFYCYAILNVVFLMLSSRHYWKIKRGYAFFDPNIIKLLKMMGPLLLGYSVVFINQLVDKIIVSGFDAGTVTAMNYASVLSNFITTFIGSICAVLFTYVTQDLSKGEGKAAASLTQSSLIQMVTVFIPICVLTLLNSTDIVKLVYGRGKFGSEDVKNCAIALVGYSCMFVPFIFRELYSRFQYGYEDSKHPMINSTISIIINIALSIILSRVMGVLGVTFATSFSVAVCGLLNYISSKKRNRYISFAGAGSILIRWSIGICLLVVVSCLGKIILVNANGLIRFGLITVVSLFLYSLILMPILKQFLHSISYLKGKRNDN